MNLNYNKILRSSFVKFSRSFAQLLLSVNGDEVWLKFASVRKSWHYVVLISVATIFYNIFIGLIIVPLIEGNESLVFFLRLIDLIILISVLSLFLILIYNYYKNLLSTGIDLRFKNIPFFYFGFHIILGIIYMSLYCLNPLLFSYQNPLIIPSPIQITMGIKGALTSWEFILYSLATSFSLHYPRIESNSFLISLFNVFQAIMNVIFVSFFLATFIQKSGSQKK